MITKQLSGKPLAYAKRKKSVRKSWTLAQLILIKPTA